MRDEKTLSIELDLPVGVLQRAASDPRSLYFYQRRELGKKKRVLRIPQSPLMEIQKAIKAKILDPMPLAKTVHGWRKKRSTKTYAGHHVGQALVLNADIQDFFPSVDAGRVHRFWIEAGYSRGAAELLTSLTTLDNQLPQGSPTSQSIGNHVQRGLHRRLSELARRHRLNFGSYGDEVSLSGRRRAAKLKGLTLRIIEQEGFKANPDKVKVMPRNQRQELAGNIVNKKNGPGRPKYRDLRAILHNCLRLGPETQNRKAHPNFKQHLQGRIAQFRYMNPRLGDHLLAEFKKIRWDECI
ncbi:MAG: reverse transcriptase family protein [Candidatus Acidiferrales bacterium]